MTEQVSTGRCDSPLLQAFVDNRLILVKIAARITGCRSRAEDVVQDAYFRLQSAPTITSSFKAQLSYLFQIVRNLAIDHYRKQALELKYSGTEEEGLNVVIHGASPETSHINFSTLEHIADALKKGAKLLSGGKVIDGNFFEPTILVDVPKDAAVAKEETFGPLAPLFRFKDEAEVIAMSNDTEFGLASYFYARDLGRVFRVAEALEYGMVGVNTGLISNEVAPFGGIKASGLGREGSKYGIEDYLEIKYLCLGI